MGSSTFPNQLEKNRISVKHRSSYDHGLSVVRKKYTYDISPIISHQRCPEYVRKTTDWQRQTIITFAIFAKPSVLKNLPGKGQTHSRWDGRNSFRQKITFLF